MPSQPAGQPASQPSYVLVCRPAPCKCATTSTPTFTWALLMWPPAPPTWQVAGKRGWASAYDSLDASMTKHAGPHYYGSTLLPIWDIYHIAAILLPYFPQFGSFLAILLLTYSCYYYASPSAVPL